MKKYYLSITFRGCANLISSDLHLFAENDDIARLKTSTMWQNLVQQNVELFTLYSSVDNGIQSNCCLFYRDIYNKEDNIG